MRARLRQLAERIDALALRQRVLLLIVAVAVLVALADVLVFRGLREGLSRTDREQTRVMADIGEARAEIDRLEDELARNPGAELRERVAELQASLKAVDAELRAETLELISPSQMVAVLRALIEGNEGLELIAVRSEAAQRLDVGGANEDVDRPAVYRHGVSLELRGPYREAVRYLRAVEGLGWRLFWDELDIEVVDYPTTRIRLRVHTLSLDEEWIGV